MLKDNNIGTISMAPDDYNPTKLGVSKLTIEDDAPCGWLPNLSKQDKAFIAKIRKIESDQPKVKARNFREFSSRIAKVEYSNEAGKCCIRGHDVDDINLPEFLRRNRVAKPSIHTYMRSNKFT